MTTPPSPRHLFLLLALSLAWAAGYLFVGAAEPEVPPITATAVMCLIAAAVMLPWVALGMRRPLRKTLTRRPWIPAVMGLTAVALPNLAVVAAEDFLEADEAAVLGTTVPILTFLLTTFVTRETRFSPSRLLGVLIALVGLVVFVGWRNLVNGGAQAEGIAIMILGGAVFALNGVFVARQTEDLDSAALGAWTMAFATPALVAAAFLFEQPLAVEISGQALLALLAEGLIGLAFAYLLYYVLVAQAGALFTSLYAFLVPPLGVLLVSLTRWQPPSGNHLAGMAIVLLGLFWFNRPPPSPSPPG